MELFLPDYENNPTHVDMSIPTCKKALLVVDKVEEIDNSEKGYSNAVQFTLKIKEHDEEEAVGRTFNTTFWEPDEKADRLKLQATVARWKQLCLATGIRPENGKLEAHAFHGESFYGEIKNRKAKDGKVFADLGQIYFDE